MIIKTIQKIIMIKIILVILIIFQKVIMKKKMKMKLKKMSKFFRVKIKKQFFVKMLMIMRQNNMIMLKILIMQML